MGPEQFVQAYFRFATPSSPTPSTPQRVPAGATGRVHDWSVSAELVRRSLRPVILAGGLTPANVREAIKAQGVRPPWTCTGVEGPDGSKDPQLVRAFVRAARAGFAEAMAP